MCVCDYSFILKFFPVFLLNRCQASRLVSLLPLRIQLFIYLLILNLLLITGLIAPLSCAMWSKGEASLRLHYVPLSIDILQAHNLLTPGWQTMRGSRPSLRHLWEWERWREGGRGAVIQSVQGKEDRNVLWLNLLEVLFYYSYVEVCPLDGSVRLQQKRQSASSKSAKY